MSLPPSNPAYAALADALAKAGMARESLLLLRHMRAAGVAPDEVSMNTFVRVLKDEGRYADALALFRDWCDGWFEVDFLDLDCSAVDSDGPMQFLLAEIGDDKFSAAAGGAPDLDGVPKKPKLVATYNTMIDLYGKAGRLKDALDMFVDMPAHGVMPDTYTFNTLINIFGLSGNITQAGALFASMVVRGINPDTKTYNVMMTVFASIGDLEGVLKYYRQIGTVGLCPDAVSYRIVLQALCKRNMVQDVEDVIEAILNSGSFVPEQSLPVVMKMYVDLGLLDEAIAFFERHCRGKGVSSKNYAAIMDAFAEKGLWEEAEHVFYSEREDGDIVEYNVMIKAYGQAKQYESVSSLIESMKESGIPPDKCTYNSSIQMFSVGGFPQKAKKLLDEMKDAGFEPKCETYSAVIRSYSRHYQVTEAVDLFSEMKASGVEPNIVVYGLLIDMFAEIGSVKEALYYRSLMEESGISPNKVILTSLIKAYGKVNCWKEAQELYSRIKNMDGGPDIIASNALLNLYANLGMVTKAKELFDSLRKNSCADDVSHTTMIYLYKSVGFLNESIKIAHVLQKSALLSNCASYNAVMASYVAEGSLRGCAELVQQMLAANIPPNASTFGMILSVLKKNHVSMEEVVQLESAYNDGRDSVKQAIVALLLSVAGMHAAAVEICEQLLKPDWTLDPCAYNVCFKIYASCGKVEKAFSLFTRMKDLGLKPDTITCIDLTTFCRKPGMSEGLFLYRNDWLSMPPRNTLVHSVKTGKTDVAIQLVKK
ncbi:hypothetical protein EJB05_51689, partial [Eragrostis curvula]